MQIDKIKEQKPIPMLRTAVHRDLKIAGCTVRVHKPKARQAAMVAQRLMESFGETLVRIFVSPDEELSKVFAGESKVANAQLFRMIFAGGFLEKAIQRLRELGHEIGPDHLVWYLEHTIVGNVELDGYRFQTLEEMDDSGFGMADYFKCLQVAVELAIYPTSDDPGTDAGKSDLTSESQAPRVGQPRKAQQGKKRRGGTDKAGQSVRMSAPSG